MFEYEISPFMVLSRIQATEPDKALQIFFNKVTGLPGGVISGRLAFDLILDILRRYRPPETFFLGQRIGKSAFDSLLAIWLFCQAAGEESRLDWGIVDTVHKAVGIVIGERWVLRFPTDKAFDFVKEQPASILKLVGSIVSTSCHMTSCLLSDDGPTLAPNLKELRIKGHDLPKKITIPNFLWLQLIMFELAVSKDHKRSGWQHVPHIQWKLSSLRDLVLVSENYNSGKGWDWAIAISRAILESRDPVHVESIFLGNCTDKKGRNREEQVVQILFLLFGALHKAGTTNFGLTLGELSTKKLEKMPENPQGLVFLSYLWQLPRLKKLAVWLKTSEENPGIRFFFLLLRCCQAHLRCLTIGMDCFHNPDVVHPDFQFTREGGHFPELEALVLHQSEPKFHEHTEPRVGLDRMLDDLQSFDLGVTEDTHQRLGGMAFYKAQNCTIALNRNGGSQGSYSKSFIKDFNAQEKEVKCWNIKHVGFNLSAFTDVGSGQVERNKEFFE
ncbi:hypothetical protein T439DRAFT_384490 [Meredithblackwellia eburnea MCA 4105]